MAGFKGATALSQKVSKIDACHLFASSLVRDGIAARLHAWGHCLVVDHEARDNHLCIFTSTYFYLYICILYLHLYIFIYIFSFLIVSIIFCFLIWTIEYFIIPRSSIITTTTAITIACNGKTYLNCDSPAAIYMT